MQQTCNKHAKHTQPTVFFRDTTASPASECACGPAFGAGEPSMALGAGGTGHVSTHVATHGTSNTGFIFRVMSVATSLGRSE